MKGTKVGETWDVTRAVGVEVMSLFMSWPWIVMELIVTGADADSSKGAGKEGEGDCGGGKEIKGDIA